MEEPVRGGERSRPLRVAVLLKTNRGGSWFVTQGAELVRRGHAVKVFVADENGLLEEKLAEVGCEVVRSPAMGGASPWRRLVSLPALHRDLREWDPDVVNYHLYYSALIGRLLSFRRKHTATVHSVPGPLFLEAPLVRFVERALSRFDDLIICSSQAVYGRYRGLGVPARKCVVVPYGIDLEAREPAQRQERDEARAALGVSSSQLVVVMVAYFYGPKRLVHRGRGIKGHDLVLEVWPLFKQQYPRASLFLVGGGFGQQGEAYRAGLLAEASRSEEMEDVHAVGSVADVSIYYHAADFSLAPSRSENLGAAAEASAFGVPTVGSAIGGIPEMVIDGHTGWLFPSGSPASLLAAMLRAANDATARAQLGQAARRRAEEYVDERATSKAYADEIERAGLSAVSRRA